VVYQDIEDRGVRDNFKKMHPIYSRDTFTGRSKSLSFNVQGATEEYDIKSIFDDDKVFVHFDWLAADIRMASFMSQDERMELAFKQSDPYTILVEYLNDPEFSRDKIKIEFLRAFYSLKFDDPIFGIYPRFKEYMQSKVNELDESGYSTSIVGRRYYLKGDNKLGVFNAQFQGSVAHAMQALLVKIYQKFRYNILTEMHDSVVLCCPEKLVIPIIKDVVNIMKDPLSGYVDPSPIMPVKVSVGRKWKAWKTVRVYR
jgi:DNA polymerase I-like protein with 3'-5' exonuclease and polymerase domains